MTTRLDRLETIAALAERVRFAQRLFYRRRDRDALIEAKTLERELDTALAELHVEEAPRV